MDPKKLRSEIMDRTLERSATIDFRAADTEKRTVEIAFSSELPVERWFGVEILDHARESVKLDRLSDGAAVLVNHDADDHIGVVESARVDDDRRGRAVVRFGRGARAEEIFSDVLDGIRRKVSVGYRVNRYEVTEREGAPDEIRVTDWTPFELSFVAIPADDSVGVNRAHPPLQQATEEDPTMDPKKQNQGDDAHGQEPAAAAGARSQEPATPAVDRDAELSRLRTEETRRVDSIRQMAEKFELEELSRKAIAEGWSVPQFNEQALEAVGQRNADVRTESDHDGEVDLSRKDRERFSLVRLMDAVRDPRDRKAAERAAFELEVSQEAQRGFGDSFQARGEFVPTSLLEGRRTLTAGTPTDGQELVATDLLGESYIEVLRNASAAMQAGLTMLPGLVGDVQIPRQTSGASSTWVTTEDGDATLAEPQFDQIALAPKDLAVYTEVTRRLLMQSTPSIDGIIRRDLAIAQALGIDAAVLYGAGATGEPQGIATASGVNTPTAFAGAVPTWDELVAMLAAVKGANAETGPLTWLIESTTWAGLMTSPKQSGGAEGNFILADGSDRLVGRPFIESEQVTAGDVFVGNFREAVMGEWGGLELSVDPYTHSLKGRVRYVVFKTVDIALRHPAAFAFNNDGL